MWYVMVLLVTLNPGAYGHAVAVPETYFLGKPSEHECSLLKGKLALVRPEELNNVQTIYVHPACVYLPVELPPRLEQERP